MAFNWLKGILGGGLFGDKNLLFGSESEMQPFNQQSLQALLQMLSGEGIEGNKLYGAGSNFLQNLLSGSPEAYQAFEAPLYQNFEQRIAPQIAERFASMGTGGGASSSSGLQQALAQAGRGLQTDIGALRGGLQLQALGQGLNYAQQPFANKLAAAQAVPGQYYEIPGQPGLLQSGLQAFAGGAGRAFGGR